MLEYSSVRRAWLTAAGAAALLMAMAPQAAQAARGGPAAHSVPAAASAQPGQSVTIDGNGGGRTFQGFGAVSGNGAARLLTDYPPRQRSQILDYLFKPGYGASLQVLKVEIGADTDSTSGAEPSVERQPGQVDCDAGYEWWLMAQARARNPDIRFYGLEWGAPGWLHGGFWSQDNIGYLLTWLGCARQHGFTISYLGGRDESGYDKGFYEGLHQALRANGYATQVVATDDHNPPDYWAVATDAKNDRAFSDAVDIFGEHDVCVWRSLYQHCNASQDALDSGKPLWNSEQSAEDYQVGAGPLARAANRDYIDARVTANLNWALIGSSYGDFPVAGTGLMLADRPWSGYYDVGPEIWVDAQTTQFAQPGWRYIDSASGYLSNGASYVTLRSPRTADYSTVIETMDATAPETVRFRAAGGLSAGTVHQWSTDVSSGDPATWFVHDGNIRPAGGSYTVTLQPGHVYTLSTTTGQGKGSATPPAGPGGQLPMPLHQDFDNVAAGQPAPYFSDVNGAFQAEPCGAGRPGGCYGQEVIQAPIAWHGYAEPPATIAGDPRWWGDYEVSADAMLQGAGYLELLGRVESQQHNTAGYHLRFAGTGGWELYTEDTYGQDTTLASGTAAFGIGSWHTLALRFRGTTVTAFLDGRQLAAVQDGSHTTGQAGFQVSPWQRAQFDNLSVIPDGPVPRFIPHARMTAAATSAHTANDFGSDYGAGNAIDDRVETSWRSEYSPAAPLPQAITLDLHQVRRVGALAYKPPVTSPDTGTITGYQVELSPDGRSYRPVASGTWPATIATKVASWGRPVPARYVRLVATSATGCPQTASAAEIDVSTTPITDFAALSGPPGSGGGGLPAQFDHLVPQSQLTATATSYHPGYQPSLAIDGNCASFWHVEWSPPHPLPQSITLDLGGSYATDGLSYLPRQDGNHNGNVTAYNVYVSSDGQNFTKVTSGLWAPDSSVKSVTWQPATARYVRLEAAGGFNGYASAAEINIAYQPGPEGPG